MYGTTITNKDKVFVLGEKIPKDLIINVEDNSDDVNHDLYKNQYVFGLHSEGEIVKDYYGKDNEEKHNDSESDSDSEESIITKDGNTRTGGKSTKTSPKIQFSKLGDNNLTETGFGQIKDTKSSIKETKTVVGSINKTNLAMEGVQGPSSLLTTKTIIDDLNLKVDYLEKQVLPKIKDTLYSQDKEIRKTVEETAREFIKNNIDIIL